VENKINREELQVPVEIQVKRETGGNPVRTRRCKSGVFCNTPLGNREGMKDADA